VTKILVDQLGNQHTFINTPKRIISLVPSQTELLFDLGLEDSIIGITKFCVHPFHLKSTKTIVGGTKNVKFNKIKELQPDIIICNKEENSKEIVDELSEICPVWVTNVCSIEDNIKMIQDFGEIFNKRTNSSKWIDKINNANAEFNTFILEKPSYKVAYFIWKNPYMVAGNNTFINELLSINKFENVYKSKDRYPEVEIKDLVDDGNPDLIFLSSEPYPFKDKDGIEIGRILQNAKIILVDGEMFSWHGTRLLKAFNYFRYLHNNI